MDTDEPKVKGTHRRPGTDLPETGNPQSAIRDPQSNDPQSAIIRGKKWPRFAIPVIAVLILAVSAGIGGFCYDPAALTKPSDGMAGNPAVPDFAQAVGFIDDNYAVAPDKERLTRGAGLGMLHSLDPHSGFYGRGEFREVQGEPSRHFLGLCV